MSALLGLLAFLVMLLVVTGVVWFMIRNPIK